MMKRPVLHALLISLALSGLGFAFALWSVGGPKALLKVGELTPRYLLYAAAALLASFVISALRLAFICRSLGYRLRLRHALRAHVLGLFSAAVTPGGSGNVAGIALTLDLQGAGGGRAWAAALATMSSDTTFHAWAMPLSLIALYSMGAYPRTPLWTVIGIVTILLTVAFAYLLLFKVSLIGPIASRVLRGPLLRFRRRGLRLAASVIVSSRTFASAPLWQHVVIQLLTAAAWASYFTVLHFLLVGLHVHLGFGLVLVGQTVVSVMSTFVPTPGASGFFEVVLSWFLISKGSGEAGPATVFVWRLLTFYSLFILGPLLGGYMIVRLAAAGNKPKVVTQGAEADPA